MRSTVSFFLATLLALASARTADADTVLLADGRTVDCTKASKEADGRWKLTFPNGDVHFPGAQVKDAFVEGAEGFVPKNDEERAKAEKGLVPYAGRWVSKAERDSLVAKKGAEVKRRIAEAKAHRLWRNRYKSKTANFEFEYTIPPEIARGYMDILEAYFAYFSKNFNVQRPKEKLKVCFYHDYDTFLEVSGAGWGTLAYYRFVPPRELNFYYDRHRPEETTAILFHEAQHYLSHLFNLSFHIPHCMSESFAEYFAGSKWDPVKKVMVTGGLQEGRLTEVQTDIAKGERRSLSKLLANELGYDDYTWGWTFVHFMMESPKYGPKFRKFYSSMPTAKDFVRSPFRGGEMTTVEGGALTMAFRKYMGIDDLGALEKEWHAYIDEKLKVESVYGFEEAAFAAQQSGRRLRAKRFFKLALEKGSKNPIVMLRYGGLVEHEDSALAQELFRKGIELDPLNTSLYVALGRLLRRTGDEESEKEGKRLLALARDINADDAEAELLLEEALEKVREEPLPAAPAPTPEEGD
jgi:hypothetical protein